MEHMTIQEVDIKATHATDRITTLEDEYKALQQKIDDQETRMAAASSQATDAQALLDSNLVE
jgi:predicted  nucleic acid-binding Zn-ribbon protein